jgi:hypothetical protein
MTRNVKKRRPAKDDEKECKTNANGGQNCEQCKKGKNNNGNSEAVDDVLAAKLEIGPFIVVIPHSVVRNGAKVGDCKNKSAAADYVIEELVVAEKADESRHERRIVMCL